MPNLSERLELERCPHCMVHKPTLKRQHAVYATQNHLGGNDRYWATYHCVACGGAVVAAARKAGGDPRHHAVSEIYPQPVGVHEDIPNPARRYLAQAKESLHTPDGAGMLAASAVDAMLKAKGCEQKSLYEQIKKAVENHLITEDMGKWAHQIRMDANDPRHADAARPHLTKKEAERCVDFAEALAEILFVLTARVDKGIEDAGGGSEDAGGGSEDAGVPSWEPEPPP